MKHIIQPGDESAMRRLGSYLRDRLKVGAVRVTVAAAESLRTQEQSARMWAMLGDLSRQVLWPVDGQMVRMSTEEWKDVMTAGLTHEQRVASGINGGFVILGRRTSKMSIRTMSELIELMFAFGAAREVQWSDPKQPRDEDFAGYREAA